MTLTSHRRPLYVFLTSATAIITIWTVVLRGQLVATNPTLAAHGVAFDLMVAIPALYWWLVVRRGFARPTSVVPVFAASALLARLFMMPLGTSLKWPFVVSALAVEGALVVWAFTEFRKRARSAAGFEAFREVLERLVPGRIAAIVVSEVAVFYYALFSWRRERPESPTSFTCYRTCGWGVIAFGLLIAVVAESIALHLWLQTRWPIVAWIVTLLEVYGILWIIADLRSMQLMPIEVRDDSLVLQQGWRWRAVVSYAEIKSVSRSGEHDFVFGSFDPPNAVISFAQPLTLAGLYGLRKTVASLGIVIDDAGRFEALMRARGLWREPDPIVPQIVEAVAPVEPKYKLTAEQWRQYRPEYISEDEWMRQFRE